MPITDKKTKVVFSADSKEWGYAVQMQFEFTPPGDSKQPIEKHKECLKLLFNEFAKQVEAKLDMQLLNKVTSQNNIINER